MNILLIEDEMLAMDELRFLMRPYEKDHVVAGFDNGEDALDYARQHVPDIVVSDIRMPGMSGLEVVQEILSAHPRTQIILLSGYNDFEYARTALKLGAKEYLLKPVTASELEAAIDRALDAVRTEEAKSRNQLEWSLTRLFRGMDASDRESGQVFDGDWLLIAVLLENWKSPFTWPQSQVSLEAFVEWLRKDVHPDAVCLDMDVHLRMALLPVPGTERRDRLRHAASRVHEFLGLKTGIVHTAYDWKKDSETLQEAYQRCLQRLESQVRLGAATFMTPQRGSTAQSFWDSARRVEAHIQHKEYGMFTIELRRMLEALRRDEATLKQTAVLLSDFLYALKYKLGNTQGELDDIGEGSIYDELKTCRTDENLLEWLTERLSGYMAGVEERTPQPKQIVPALLDYVQHHYGESVQLQDFASRYHVSIGYLSKLFKAETGMNFSDHLIRVRMNKAMELMDAGYKRVAEIGRLVGYEDPKFFSQTFKRYTGVTPLEYKRKA